MDPYYLNSLPGSRVSADACAQIIYQDSQLYDSLQTYTSESLPTAFPQPYPLFGQVSHGSFPAPHMPRSNPAPSSRPSAGRNLSRTSSSLSNHGIHTAGCVSVQPQGWIPPPCPESVPISGTGPNTTITYDAVFDNGASTRHQDPNQSCLVAKAFPPAPSLESASQARITGPDTRVNVPLSVNIFPVPRETFVSTHRRQSDPPHTPADPQDIEYAQYRYGNARCFYRCRFGLSGSPCNKWIVGDRTRVLRHLRSHHHLQTGPATPAHCFWEKCTLSRPMKHENLSRHVVTHLGVKWKCPHCSHLFSRDDAVHRHMERVAPGMDVSEAEVVPGREACSINDLQIKRPRHV